MSRRSALIVGLETVRLGAAEARFLRSASPVGFILFARNVQSPAQVRTLVADALEAIGSAETLVLVDQEGGRVRRLRPPFWRPLPAARTLGALGTTELPAGLACATLIARLTAEELVGSGINMNCAPVVDLPVDGAHDVIGDRAYGTALDLVVPIARAVADGYMAGGVVPVMKHIPGHGRAIVDSHLALPVVDAPLDLLRESDFAAFRALSEVPAAMTAHVVYPAVDARAPASTSAMVISSVVRGEIGFDGLLMSDDIGMKALEGPIRARAEAVIAAGCDLVLHCSGNLEEMRSAAEGVPVLGLEASSRLARCLAVTRRRDPFDREAAERALQDVLAFESRLDASA